MKKIILSFLLIILILLPSLNLVNSNESYTIKRIPKDLYPDVINKSQNVLLETFTATWCGWCHYAYEVFDELRKNFGDKILNIRYHNQDDLSIQEVPDRVAYYKVSGYPTVLINGSKKIVGVDENSYPEFEKIVKDLLTNSPKLGIYADGFVSKNELKLKAEIEQFDDEAINGNFMAVLLESNIEYEKNRIYDYVARKVFPSFSGLKLDFDGQTNFLIEFSFPLETLENVRNYKVIFLVQNMETREVYNSTIFEFDSLIIDASEPISFAEEVPRDTLIKVKFSEGLITNAIKKECFEIIAKDNEKIGVDFSYDREENTLILSPDKYFKPNYTYALYIQSLENCLISVNRRILKTPYIIKFKTSNKPELSLYVNSYKIEFGEISKLDDPSFSLNIIEEHGNPIRVKLYSPQKWITLSKTDFYSANETIEVKINQLFMTKGENNGVISLQTILGVINIEVTATLLSDEYPVIKFLNYTPFAFSETLLLYGRTDGYRLYLNDKEVYVDADGYFNVELKLWNGFNIFTFTAMNMQRKEKKEALIILRLI